MRRLLIFQNPPVRRDAAVWARNSSSSILPKEASHRTFVKNDAGASIETTDNPKSGTVRVFDNRNKQEVDRKDKIYDANLRAGLADAKKESTGFKAQEDAKEQTSSYHGGLSGTKDEFAYKQAPNAMPSHRASSQASPPTAAAVSSKSSPASFSERFGQPDPSLRNEARTVTEEASRQVRSAAGSGAAKAAVAAGTAKNAAEDVKEAAQDAWRETKIEMKETWQDIKEAATTGAETAREKARRASEKAGNVVEEAKESASRGVDKLKNKAGEKYFEAKETAQSVAHEARKVARSASEKVDESSSYSVGEGLREARDAIKEKTTGILAGAKHTFQTIAEKAKNTLLAGANRVESGAQKVERGAQVVQEKLSSEQEPVSKSSATSRPRGFIDKEPRGPSRAEVPRSEHQEHRRERTN